MNRATARRSRSTPTVRAKSNRLPTRNETNAPRGPSKIAAQQGRETAQPPRDSSFILKSETGARLEKPTAEVFHAIANNHVSAAHVFEIPTSLEDTAEKAAIEAATADLDRKIFEADAAKQ